MKRIWRSSVTRAGAFGEAAVGSALFRRLGDGIKHRQLLTWRDIGVGNLRFGAVLSCPAGFSLLNASHKHSQLYRAPKKPTFAQCATTGAA